MIRRLSCSVLRRTDRRDLYLWRSVWRSWSRSGPAPEAGLPTLRQDRVSSVEHGQASPSACGCRLAGLAGCRGSL